MELLPKYPAEKSSLRFYKYKFSGFSKPIIIEAYNKTEARQKLKYVIDQLQITNSVIDESLSLPIFGRTTKISDGMELTWVGNLSPTCWMPTEDFEKLNLEF